MKNNKEYLTTTQNAIGRDSRKSSSEIRDALELESGGPTNEHIRDIIRQLIFNFQVCIGSLMWGNGYWIIQNEDELNEVVEGLENRADSTYERANVLRTNWERRVNNG